MGLGQPGLLYATLFTSRLCGSHHLCHLEGKRRNNVINKPQTIKFIEALNIEMTSATFEYLSLCQVRNTPRPGSSGSSAQEMTSRKQVS